MSRPTRGKVQVSTLIWETAIAQADGLHVSRRGIGPNSHNALPILSVCFRQHDCERGAMFLAYEASLYHSGTRQHPVDCQRPPKQFRF
jgi:hypothetical protein